MFAATRNGQSEQQEQLIKKTGVQMSDITPELKAMMKRSLKSNRWEAIDLGA